MQNIEEEKNDQIAYPRNARESQIQVDELEDAISDIDSSESLSSDALCQGGMKNQ